MRENTHYVRSHFNLSAPETSIQSTPRLQEFDLVNWLEYGCSVSGFNRGTLFITQNYLCYKSKVNDRQECASIPWFLLTSQERIPFSKVQNVQLSSGLNKKITVLCQNWIFSVLIQSQVTNDKKPFIFSEFQPGVDCMFYLVKFLPQGHLKEAFALITYLWQNPVSVVDTSALGSFHKVIDLVYSLDREEAEKKRILAARAEAKKGEH